ncbi:hypothetical protein AAFF_G00277180 [Aldrovandia affinis]|uniref:Uncharacterized protein n=1 Tax=Aldrovandia affinis TaxID=143900 RepID=A0AAD7RAL7_9TELE|nr:hypothetical protein AAFF_G00277180 [Aldrovandia affinis]
MKKPGGLWDTGPPLDVGAAVGEQLKALALSPPQAECALSAPRAPQGGDTTPQSSDSGSSKSAAPTSGAPPAVAPPERTQAQEPPRFPFVMTQGMNPFQPLAWPQSRVRKAISAEARSLTRSTVNSDLTALQTPAAATRPESQTAASPVPATATAPPAGSGAGLEEPPPGDPPTGAVPPQPAQPAATLVGHSSFQLIIAPAARNFSVSVLQLPVGRAPGGEDHRVRRGEDRTRRVTRLRKRQSDMSAAARRALIPLGAPEARGPSGRRGRPRAAGPRADPTSA